MPERQFFDDRGQRWEVWEVCPDAVERRLSGGNRAVEDEDQPSALDFPDRRRGERRTHMRVPETLRDGWLAFESTDQRRRLAPVPEHWRSMGEEELRELLSQAHVVPIPERPQDR